MNIDAAARSARLRICGCAHPVNGQTVSKIFNSRCTMTECDPLVFVVEDDDAVREALERVLRSAGFRVQLFNSASDFLLAHNPDDSGCLILDVGLPGLSGLDLQQELIKAGIHIPTIFITGHGDIRMSVHAIKSGAVEFLTKPIDPTDLLSAVKLSIEKDFAERKERVELASLRHRFDSLTPREREVMQLVVSGLLNKQIAADVGISEITVKIHRGNAMRKMEANSLAELVIAAERLGLPNEGLH
jgi:FixJ family two-component response regulator